MRITKISEYFGFCQESGYHVPHMPRSVSAALSQRFLAIGDSSLDVFVMIDEATVSCQINKQHCLLCLNYADKIPVTHMAKIPAAGNASNAAVGAARLGAKSAILSVIGDDDIGNETLAYWKKEKVSTQFVSRDTQHPTNYSTVLSYQGERTILVHHEPRHYTFPAIPSSAWIYYTSLGKGHEQLERKLLAFLRQHPQTKITFNPGSYQLRRGLDSLKPIIARSTIFILNKEEAEALLGQGALPVPALLDALSAIGPEMTVITDGPNGSFARNGGKTWQLGTFPGPETERTGAGDAYATGFTLACMNNQPLPEAMRWGTANAWSVIKKIGPQAGLLNSADMVHALAKFAKIKPVEVNS